MSETLWNFYRVEGERPMVEKVRECVAAFEKKLGAAANVVGVPSSLPATDEAALRAEGLEVVRNVPAWSISEIWVGRREEVAYAAS